jgi:hypothetical protein
MASCQELADGGAVAFRKGAEPPRRKRGPMPEEERRKMSPDEIVRVARREAPRVRTNGCVH